jgi:hypothetical protein
MPQTKEEKRKSALGRLRNDLHNAKLHFLSVNANKNPTLKDWCKNRIVQMEKNISNLESNILHGK